MSSRPPTSSAPRDSGELHDAHTAPGRGLFRWRGHIPLLALAVILVATGQEPIPVGGVPWTPAWIAAGWLLGLLGLAVRAAAIGFAPEGTSGRATRVLRADTLTTDGMYALVRHPLYLGNLLLWLGVAAFSGRPAAFAATLFGFFAIYGPIMSGEERYLASRFGETFERWRSRTPALLPRSLRWVTPPRIFSARTVVRRDYHAVLAFVSATWAVVAARAFGLTRAPVPGTFWWIYLGVGTAFFAIAHGLKKKRVPLTPR